MPDFLHRVYLGNSVRAWLIAAVVALLSYLALSVLRRVLVRRLGAIAQRTTTDWDDAVVDLVGRTRNYFLVTLAVAFATRGLALPPRFDSRLTAVLELFALLQIGMWGAGIVMFLTGRMLAKRDAGNDRLGIAAVRALGVGARIIVWIVVALVALQFVFDKQVTALITGLGVGGIALALAVQNILGDLLAAIAIVFDRPFDVGDFIVVGDAVGTVEEIGLKTTRVRSLSGEQLILSNGDLLKSRIRNFKRMYQRRILFSLDVTYDTPPDVMAAIPGMVRAIVEAQEPVKFDRCHFSTFADSSLRVETVYYVLDPDYGKYMNIQQAINLEILRQFNAAKIGFAFPSRTIYHEGLPPRLSVEVHAADDGLPKLPSGGASGTPTAAT